jgi:hypothetical protein
MSVSEIALIRIFVRRFYSFKTLVCLLDFSRDVARWVFTSSCNTCWQHSGATADRVTAHELLEYDADFKLRHSHALPCGSLVLHLCFALRSTI